MSAQTSSPQSQPPQTQAVQFSSAGRTVGAQLARPQGDGPFPAVVVIHEIFGLNDNIREVTDRFARAGYLALAVDLFADGPRGLCMARLMGGLLLNPLEHQGVRDLREGLNYLGGRTDVDAGRLGAVGYCLGGSLALALACTDGRLQAVAPYYGMNPRPLTALDRACPVVGSYPQQDFTAKGARVLEAQLERSGVPHDVKIYPGTKHSFNNDHGPNYDAAASDDAWARTLSFFEEHVKGGGGE